ncbi:hypothetical protein LY624_04890 [Pseudoalteromonas sp. N1230-9]|uniref:hypothetical protein n=1 Tax=Pseudoalteromonas sp. N1230-9 TaxID=2907156 RepID=UPI002B29F774|nr:hypothetical protein LY624_04890 [Pseudoalteromonas sp. N1230-9]
MPNFKLLIVSIILYLFTYSAPVLSNDKLIFFYENRYGEEIQVSASDSAMGEIDYTFIIPDDIEPEEAFYDYVVSTLSQQNYIYTQNGAPCPTCNVAHFVGSGSNSDVSSSVPLVREQVSGRKNIANKFIEGIATQLGTRSVNEIFDKAKDQKTKESPIKFVVNSRNGVAMSVCEITASGCEDMPEVVVLSLANNKLVFEIEKGNDLNYWERTQKIHNAIVNYSRAKKYTCRITFTGDKDNLKSQITCFPSY